LNKRIEDIRRFEKRTGKRECSTTLEKITIY
jgi:hypothetical protein